MKKVAKKITSAVIASVMSISASAAFADENAYGSNPISLTITGEQGTSLVTSPDSRVTDFNVEWEFDGFRTLDGRQTGETESYCENYAVVETTAPHNTAVDFKSLARGERELVGGV